MPDDKCQYVDFFGKKCEIEAEWDVFYPDGEVAACCHLHQRHFVTTFRERKTEYNQADGVK